MRTLNACRFLLAVAAIASLPTSILAQVRPADANFLSSFESRELSRELRRTRSLERTTQAIEAPIAWSFSIGGAYSKDPDGPRQTTLPIEVSSVFNGRRTSVTVSMDAYSRLEEDGQTQSGHSEATLRVGQVLDQAKQWRAAIGAKIPTGSDLSARHASQFGTLSYTHPLSETFAMTGAGNLAHTNATLPDGVARHSETGILRATSSFGAEGKSDFWIQGLGSHRKGTSTYREVGAGYDFPITKTADGSLSVTKGLTSGARAAGVELDIAFSF